MAIKINQKAYDIEVLPNYFSITIVDIFDYLKVFNDSCNISIKKGKEYKTPIPLVEKFKIKEIIDKLSTVKKWQFDITDYDDSQHLKLIAFINSLAPHKDEKGNTIITYMYGFNSGSYDKFMVACLLMYTGICKNSGELCKKLYETSQKIIDLQKDKESFFRDYYMKTLRDYALPYKDIDIMKIFALNKVGASTNEKGEKVYFGKSLKQTSINIKWYELLEFELPPINDLDKDLYLKLPKYKNLTIEQINSLVNKWDRFMIEEYRKPMNHYNLNDVFIVCEIIRLFIDEIRLRYNLSRTYEIDVMNSSRSNIANILFKKFYSDFSGLRPEQWTGKKTERTTMSFKRVIFDNVSFKTKYMQDFLERIRKTVVTSVSKDSFQENIVINKLTYTMATGGLHSQDPPRKLVSKLIYNNNIKDDNIWNILEENSFIYVHFDIASFYPSLMGAYKIAPEHLDAGVFTKLINWLKDTRVKAKHSEEDFIDGIPKDLLAQALKIVINSIYGKLGDENSDICDRLAVLKVTINGQLFILMLCEELEINNIEVVSANTDGIVVKLYKKDKTKFDEITNRWLEKTKLGADSELFSHYIDRDINNYLFKEIGKEPGYKGDFNPKIYITDLQKGYNQPIVAQAVENYFLYNKPILETLYESKDILDFCKTQNIGHKFRVEFVQKGTYDIQRNVRFYVSKNGGTLFKVDDVSGYRGNLCAGYKVKVLNTLDDLPIEERDIDYEYYYNETLKLIDPIMLGISPNQKGDKDKGIKSGKALLKKYGGGDYNSLFDNNDD